MPGLQVILACRITLDKMADTAVLRSLLQKIGKIGLGFSYYIFNAARGYDSDENARLVKEYGMKPSIKLRGSAVCTKMKHSKESVKADPKSYKTRGMIEGIFGAEETENRRLMCRFRKASTRRRFSLCKAVGWNLEALNRFECAASFGMPVEAA